MGTPMGNEIDRLKAERAELVAALRLALSGLEDFGGNDIRSEVAKVLAKLGESV